jgi:hypothetical protein
MSVNNGDVLTYIGTWTANGVFQTVNDLVSSVTTDILAQGLAVRNSSVDQSLGALIGAAGWGGQFKITLQVQVENGLGFASPDDVISIIRGAVYQETGSFPTGDSIPYGGQQGNTPTGQPAGNPLAQSTGGCIAGTGNDLSGSWSLSCWFGNLTTTGLSTVGTLVLIAIVGLILLSKAERTVS